MEYLVEGTLSVKAVLQAKRRVVNEIIVDQNADNKNIDFTLNLAKYQGIPITYLAREAIDEMASGSTHGGVLAKVGDRKYQALKQILRKNDNYLAILEGIEDPFNFGYCLRSLYAAGCNGVIVEERNWTSVVDVVTKSSAGASEYINIHISKDLSETMKDLKKQGIEVYGANRKDASNLYQTKFKRNLCIAIGGEKRGLSSKVARECSHNVYIPYANDFRNAINGSSATAILAFEIFRQKSYRNDR